MEKLDNSAVISAAAKASNDIYEEPSEVGFHYWREVDQFRFLPGGLVAGVRSEITRGRKIAYVAVRGTSEGGNWLFTNMQAWFAPFQVVDDSLGKLQRHAYQGGYYRKPAEGAMHQGFCRAFSWLWYGTEPMLDRPERSALSGLGRLRRYALLFLVLPLLVWLGFIGLNWSPSAALWLCLAAAFAFVTGEAGVWEDIFRRRPEIKDSEGGMPLKTKLKALREQYDDVVFTGHSLGGAVATVAFVVFSRWAEANPNSNKGVYLVTFGAPRVGDVEFMKHFCATYAGQYAIVQHPGDPVPALPPNGLFEVLSEKYWMKGPMGIVLLFIFPIWAGVQRLYRGNRAARWDDHQTHQVPEETARLARWFSIGNHSMPGKYLAWATQRAGSDGAS